MGLNRRWKTRAAVVTAPAVDSPNHTRAKPATSSRESTTASARLLRPKARVTNRNTSIDRSRAWPEAASMRCSSPASAR